jgi:hypothetical protein
LRTWLLWLAGMGFFAAWTFLLISGVTASWRTGWHGTRFWLLTLAAMAAPALLVVAWQALMQALQ